MSVGEHLGSQRDLEEHPLNRLLKYLDPDQEVAAQRYESIRRILIIFFRSRGFLDAEAMGDETIDRVAMRLDEVQDLMPFIRGVARHVASEGHRDPKSVSLDILPDAGCVQQLLNDDESDLRTKCLEGCLNRLPSDQRDLIVEYYKYQGGEKIARKKQLATHLRVSLDALGVRAHRIRLQLRNCVSNCVKLGRSGVAVRGV